MKLAAKLLTCDEYKAMSDKAVADGFWRNDLRIFLPGMGWYNDWYLKMEAGFLSPHYARDWAGKRPPIELVCPNGDLWCIDRKSSNGDGWQVTGRTSPAHRQSSLATITAICAMASSRRTSMARRGRCRISGRTMDGRGAVIT
jgi:hypothetical protein